MATNANVTHTLRGYFREPSVERLEAERASLEYMAARIAQEYAASIARLNERIAEAKAREDKSE